MKKTIQINILSSISLITVLLCNTFLSSDFLSFLATVLSIIYLISVALYFIVGAKEMLLVKNKISFSVLYYILPLIILLMMWIYFKYSIERDYP